MKTLFDLPRVRRGSRLTALAAAMAIVSASAGLFAPAASAQPVALNGLFALDGGVCSGGSVTGSFFRMILPAGSTSGPFLSNSDSGCSDKAQRHTGNIMSGLEAVKYIKDPIIARYKD